MTERYYLIDEAANKVTNIVVALDAKDIVVDSSISVVKESDFKSDIKYQKLDNPFIRKPDPSNSIPKIIIPVLDIVSYFEKNNKLDVLVSKIENSPYMKVMFYIKGFIRTDDPSLDDILKSLEITLQDIT